ncbi:MAG TPA: helix-turn-helix domain-containing protein [Patescibacteria group bacterium]|nr:helix-turn-helix domain-containing protein [Patescibacteria group bacterium]
MENFLSVRQIAYILKVHPLTIRRYIREGKLKAVRIGGTVRIKETELQNFHKELSVATPQQSIIIKAKQHAARPFSDADPIFRLQGRGASLK